MVPMKKADFGEVPAEVASELIGGLKGEAVVPKLARNIALPGDGAAFNVLASGPEAGWVDEGGEKPLTNASFERVTVVPRKLAAIVVVSEEAVRDRSNLWSAVVSEMPKALARKLDDTVLNQASGPGADFDTFASVPEVEKGAKENLYKAVVRANGEIAMGGYNVSAYLANPLTETIALSETNGIDTPFWTTNPQTDGTVARMLGRPVYQSPVYDAAEGKNLLVAGQWDRAVFGVADAMRLQVSSEATVDGVSLWQTNQVAVRCETTVGFRILEPEAFRRVVDPSVSPAP